MLWPKKGAKKVPRMKTDRLVMCRHSVDILLAVTEELDRGPWHGSACLCISDVAPDLVIDRLAHDHASICK